MIRESRSDRRPVPGGPTAARRTALKVVGALLGAALVLSAVIAPAFADEETGTLTSVRGSVAMQPPGVKEWMPAEAGAELAEGTRVVTAEGASVTITVGDDAIVALGEHTEVVIGGEESLSEDGSAVLLQHVEGHIELKLRLKAHHFLKEFVTVLTPHAAVCMQTQMRFQNIKVTVGPEATVVSVVQGEAEVVADGSAIKVGAGQSATTAAAGPATVEETPANAEMEMVVVAESDPVAKRAQLQERAQDGDQDQTRDRDRDGDCTGEGGPQGQDGPSQPDNPQGSVGPNGSDGPVGPNGPNGQNEAGGPQEAQGESTAGQARGKGSG